MFDTGPGLNWPIGGEIDIVETYVPPQHYLSPRDSHTERSVSVNLMTQNQMAVHAGSGCTKANNSQQTGINNSQNCTDGTGCTVLETNTNAVGSAFANAQGGVWATQFDVSGEFHLVLLTTYHVNTDRRHLVGSFVITLGSPPITDRTSLPKHQHLVLEREWNFREDKMAS